MAIFRPLSVISGRSMTRCHRFSPIVFTGTVCPFAAREEFFNLMDEEEEVQNGKVEIRPDKVRGEVTFDHVVFGYDDETLMRDVNFQAKPGKMVAIVGRPGQAN